MTISITLIKPTFDRLPDYIDALKRGWGPYTLRSQASADEQLRRIEQDSVAFVASLDDPEAKGPPVTLPDGSTVPRLPGFNRWIWDGEFCGSINLRWPADGAAMPPHVLGHIGYAVVPWKQGRGYATWALKLLLPQARARGLAYVELTTDPDNIPSQKVITSNGGYLLERFTKDAAYGGKEALRFRITL